VKQLKESGIAVESDGAYVIDLEKFKLARPILQKRDGTTIYISRDIGGAAERYEKYKFDKMIYVVAVSLTSHLKYCPC